MKSLDGLRVVLNWGAMPPDLDSHMMSPGSHVSYHSKVGLDTKLDVDDTDGFGPETVTVEKKHFGEKYVYAVHSYTDKDDPTCSRLSQSRATVYVYVGQSLIKRYAVPDQGAGNVWMVFSLDGAGEFHDLNQLLQTSGTPDAALRQALGGAAAEVPATGAVSSTSASSAGPAQVEVRPAPVTDADVLARAHEINARGEKAYHAGQLDQSIELYLQAIELDGGYGQAYSNLGLSYQKANRVAEALWANRKSIALAHGEGANVVRASSYYNIAKIYEAAGQWADAAQQFQLANTERPLKAYADGAARNAAKAAH
jgi:tetratricopeptide (TPR) repeat protein